MADRWGLVLHGGAGVIDRSHLKPAQEVAYRAALAAAARAGAAVLDTGGSALDAVEQTVRALEDDPLFNAGRGAVFTADGRIELDAAIMDGASLAAGAVAGVTATSRPITLARRVMEQSGHVFLAGAGADAFAEAQGFEPPAPGALATVRRWRALEQTLKRQGLPVPPRPAGLADHAAADLAHDEGKHGTVGAVARDRAGNLAAATSTGGVTAKRWGRIGDSPLIGAGTYADNISCAVSCTGAGEYFIRLGVARDVAALITYAGLGLQAACDRVIQDKLTTLGGDGGLIAIGRDGTPGWSFNSAGMYRARVAEGTQPVVALYRDEP